MWTANVIFIVRSSGGRILTQRIGFKAFGFRQSSLTGSNLPSEGKERPKTLISVNSTTAISHTNLATLPQVDSLFCFLQGKFDLAELEARIALEHDAYNKEAEFILGRILELKGLMKEARQHFHHVLKRDYQHSGAQAALKRLNKEAS